MWENEPRHQSYQVSGGPPSSSESNDTKTMVGRACTRLAGVRADLSMIALAMANIEATPAPSSAAEVHQWSKWLVR